MDVTGVLETTSAEVHGLSVAFGGREVLRDLSLEIPARRITVVLGRSGSGKTTFLRAFNRLNECFEGCVTRGSVRLRSAGGWTPVYGPDSPPPEELRRRVGMVFQTPNVLPMSVERNLLLPLRLRGELSRREQRGRVEDSLREAQLWEEVKDRLSAPATSLSGGQQQRLCLARALALSPEFLLLDEPTASVDYAAAERIEQLLLRLREKYTIVLVSHSLGQARRLGDRVLVLQDGALARDLTRETISASVGMESCVADLF
jgi:phosphate transport system ATP-binding protein